METTFGLRGSITPAGAVDDFTDSFKDGPFQLIIANGLIEIGYEDESQTEGHVKLFVNTSMLHRLLGSSD